MDTTTGNEFIKVYNQIQRLQNDITHVAKDLYSQSVIQYDEIDGTPQNLSDFNNDTNFVNETQVNQKISEIQLPDCSNNLKCTGDDSQTCDVPTTFEDLHTKTQESSDSSSFVATTAFVHALVDESKQDAIQSLAIGVKSNGYVTDKEVNDIVDDKLINYDTSAVVDEKIETEISKIEIPTKVSQLQNDSGYITLNDIPEDLVTSVNGQVGDVVIDIPVVPTNISAFNNDVGYITDAGVTSVNNRTGAVLVQENVQSDWNATTGLAKILNKPALKAVATSGSYNDLTDTPTIPPFMSLLSYGNSTWQDFITAYNSNSVVYCRASSNSNPSTGAQNRLAFLAYVNNATNPTEVEFQYYRSVATHSDSQQGDQVYVYKLNSTNGGTWSVIVRESYTKVVAGTNLTSSYSSGKITLNAPSNISAFTNDSGYITDAGVTSVNNQTGAVTVQENVQADWAASSGLSVILNKPNIPSNVSDLVQDEKYAGSATVGGSASNTEAIPFGIVDSTSTSTVFTATVPGITELKDGTCVLLKNGVVTSASGFTININGLGAHPTFNNMTAATADTTIFNINYTMLFIYDSTRVVGNYTGAWCCYRGYDANTNTIGYQLRGNSASLTCSDRARYYKIYFTSADNTQWVPASSNWTNSTTSEKVVNQRAINPFGPIVYTSASTNYTAGTVLAASSAWQQYALALGYSFNRTGEALTLTTNAPVYVKCAPQTNGSAIIDSTTPIVQTLPTTEDGKIYIFLGIAYSATNIELRMEHPVYYYKDGAIRLWTNAPTTSSVGNASSLNLATLTTGFTAQIPLGANLYYWDNRHYIPCFLQLVNTIATNSCQLIVDTSCCDEIPLRYWNMNNLFSGGSVDLVYQDRKLYIRLESPAVGQTHDTGCVSIGVANVDAASNWPVGINSIADIIAYALTKLEEAAYAYEYD